MSVTLIDADTAGAPMLTGQAGQLKGIFDYIALQIGWEIAYSDAYNSALRLNAVPQAVGAYLQILDDARSAGGAKEAMLRLAESVSGIESLTDPAPATQSLYWWKSATADDTERYWRFLGDEYGGYFWIRYSGAAATTSNTLCYWFGDVKKLDTTHNYNCVLSGTTTANNTSAYSAQGNVGFSNSIGATNNQWTMLRASNNLTKAVDPIISCGIAQASGIAGLSEPAGAQALPLLPIFVGESNSGTRITGQLPGVLYVPCGLTLATWESDEKSIDSETWRAYRSYNNGLAYFQVTGDWDR